MKLSVLFTTRVRNVKVSVSVDKKTVTWVDPDGSTTATTAEANSSSTVVKRSTGIGWMIMEGRITPSYSDSQAIVKSRERNNGSHTTSFSDGSSTMIGAGTLACA